MATADLIEAIRSDDAPAVRRILTVDPQLALAADDQGKTGLHWAAELDRLEIATALLEAGGKLEARTAWGASAFDWAAVVGSNAVASLLLDRGATGLTMITAAALGRVADVERFLATGPNPTRDRRRDAPSAPDDSWPRDSAHLLGDIPSDALYSAARNGHTEVVELLATHGADIDARGVFGGTALHWAALNGHAEVTQRLIDRGADRRLRDHRFDSTPSDWAVEGGHSELAVVLR